MNMVCHTPCTDCSANHFLVVLVSELQTAAFSAECNFRHRLLEMISSNARVGSGFIRAYWDTVFIVDDPSIPYVTMPPVGRVLSSRTSELPDRRALLQGMDTKFPNAIQAFRRMQTRDKAALLEHCVQEGVLEVIEQISTA